MTTVDDADPPRVAPSAPSGSARIESSRHHAADPDEGARFAANGIGHDPDDEEPPAVAVRAARGRRRRFTPRSRAEALLREYGSLVIGALIIATLIRTFLGLAFYIPSGSMIPTLEIGDRVVVSRLSYQWGEPQRGQIVVFENPSFEAPDEFFLIGWGRHVLGTVGVGQPKDKYLIKRIIGLPGETVSFAEGEVRINGATLNEPWLPAGVQTDALGIDRFEIPAGHVFMMGDNRANSTDGRVFGPVPVDDIVGRAMVRVWPPTHWGGL